MLIFDRWVKMLFGLWHPESIGRALHGAGFLKSFQYFFALPKFIDVDLGIFRRDLFNFKLNRHWETLLSHPNGM